MWFMKSIDEQIIDAIIKKTENGQLSWEQYEDKASYSTDYLGLYIICKYTGWYDGGDWYITINDITLPGGRLGYLLEKRRQAEAAINKSLALHEILAILETPEYTL
jgi:hypothetical protein